MKQQAIQYLALDVHKATIVASLRDGSGRVVMRSIVATEAKQIVALVKSAGPRVHVVFEEGTQAQWLHDLLVDHAERVVVCNVRGDSETENKSDRIDADELSERLRVGRLKSVYHGAPEVLTLKELVRSYSSLVSAAEPKPGRGSFTPTLGGRTLQKTTLLRCKRSGTVDVFTSTS